MKRITLLAVLFACGVLATSTPAFAQSASTDASNWFTGAANLLLLGRDNIDSSKFQEYREVRKGVSMPVFSFQGSYDGTDYAVFGRNVSQSDQRYSGYAKAGWFGLTFDYNQIPHQMGNNGQTLFAETAPGVWSMSATLRQQLGAAVDAVGTSARTYPFYASLLAPTIASAGFVDITSLRERGSVTLDLARTMPFDLTLTYMRELKSGARGASGGDILGVVTTSVDVLEPLDELTQDIGVRWAYNSKKGNVYATFNRNIYNDRVDSLVIDNPYRGSDLAYVSTSVPGGPGQARFSTYPDNAANRGAFGALLKLARQTRVSADVAIGRWTQNAQFLPFTINSAIFTTTGVAANSTAALPQQSLDGKIDTTSLNFAFSSRPVENLGVRLRYRSYDLTNKTTPISWLAGSTAGSPDRAWGSVSAASDAPYGFATANMYDNKTKRFDAQVGYDIQALTLEAAFRTAKLERTNREATSGKDNGYGLAAVYHSNEWLDFRLMYDWLHRTAEGETLYGFQADEAERKTNQVGFDVELTPSDKIGITLTYLRKTDDYPNRPNRIAVSGGVPVAGAQPISGTPSGLLKASYDTYTVEFDLTPNERAELNAFYTYDKNAQTNQWATTTGVALNNLLTYAGRDRGDTFGVNGRFQLVPEKWTLSVLVQDQKVNGFMGITANPTGSFYLGRVTLSPPGAQPINDFDDTRLTSAEAALAYALAKEWTFNIGYAYEKYTIADAYSDGTTIFPQSGLLFLKANAGDYKANIVYTKLSYRW